MTSDHRITPGLIHDILDALERHGYYRSDDLHADRAIGLTRDDASTVFAALDIAADDKRYRVEMCPDCPDQSCPTCQTHLHDAQAFDQMADRMPQAAPAATAIRPGPDRQPQPAADREAGQ
jgi:hypothetical protein